MSHSSSYDPQTSEPHWQSEWEAQKLFQHSEMQLQTEAQIKDKEYLLFAFAYPSGSGLHVGHVESKTALDILARYKRMNGKHVFFPVGWDAFGLPAENYAIKTGIHPAKTTLNAIHTFRRQIKRIGISYDWANEVATNHPGYYRWTQWIFLQLYKKGLAYQGTGMVNWCPSCQTVLANEQVVNGKCERCGTQVIQKQLKQWYFKITKYQDELLSGLEDVDWPEPTKQQQKHWIGKNKGLNIDFTIRNSSQKLQIWTKFWETIFGVTFLVIAPEKFNEFELINQVPQEKRAEVEAYLDASFKKTEEERKIGEKDKTGVDTGIKVINPVNGTESPLYIADYVLTNVGTGVVMGVPAHDERDFAFAKKYGLPCLQVVEYQDEALNNKVREGEASFEGEGTLVNSGEFNGQPAWGEGKKNMAEWMIEQGFGRWQTTYKLRDWLISRQRYWGAPIPIVYDPQGKPHPIKEEHLPWLLPDDVDFKPTGESPLKSSKEFFERTERLYGKGWTPECDTMDTFVDSSWYFLRYLSARNEQTFLDLEQAKKWLPVDLYLIGPEHIVLHLLYSRFFTKFLRDEGFLSFGEPFLKMRHQGMILGPDGKKMSKSKGNVINPDDIIEKYGADTLRMYEMFMGPLESDKPWDTGSVIGIYRLLQRIHALVSVSTATSGKAKSSEVFTRALHQTLKKVSEDIEDLKFNTAIAAIMILVNTWEGLPEEERLSIDAKDLQDFVAMLAPFAPFMSEALYQELLVREGKERASIHLASWPKVNSTFLEQNEITVVFQVNGKLRGEMKASPDEAKKEDLMVSRGEKIESVQRWVEGKKHLKTVFVPGKLVNFVVAE